MIVVDRGKPRHYCDLPGWWRRHKLGLSADAVIECPTCLLRYRWNRSSYDGSWRWERIGHAE